jgi:hypothetical protein
MKFRLLALLASSLWFHHAAADELPDYIRYAEDAKTSRLEVAIRTFALPSGQNVDLMAVIHIADDAYYQKLNARLPGLRLRAVRTGGQSETPDGVRAAHRRGTQAQPAGNGVTFIQQSASRYLNLTFQIGAIDYRGKNMVHADTSLAELEQLQAERGENMLTLFTRAMQAQMDGAINSARMMSSIPSR